MQEASEAYKQSSAYPTVRECFELHTAGKLQPGKFLFPHEVRPYMVCQDVESRKLQLSFAQ